MLRSGMDRTYGTNGTYKTERRIGPMCHIWPMVQLCQITQLAIGYWLLAMRAALAPLRQSSY